MLAFNDVIMIFFLFQEEIKHCLPVRINGCKSRNIRAAKIIRLRMREVEELIQVLYMMLC